MNVQDILKQLQLHNLLTEAFGSSYPQTAILKGVTTDSRKACPQGVFIAYKGLTHDGHRFVDEASANGAKVIICENLENPVADDTTIILVKDGRAAWSVVMNLHYESIADRLEFIGITGTNGKSSTVWMVRELFRLKGQPVLSLGTLGAYFEYPDESGIWRSENEALIHTTPDPDVLYDLLFRAFKKGIRQVVMEVSSHAIAQQKLLPISFSKVGFTSFSQDHLDFHLDMKSYWQWKWGFVADDSNKKSMKAICSSLMRTPYFDSGALGDKESYTVYGPKAKALTKDLRLRQYFELQKIEKKTAVWKIDYCGQVRELESPYIGSHNNENLLLAILMAKGEDELENILNLVEGLTQIPGRMEVVFRKPFLAVVDYAHTPEALHFCLKALLDEFAKPIRVVFGCGGDRDRDKRPLMARAAEALAFEVIVTSDNPRSESPKAIISDIANGFLKLKPKVEIDRHKAINEAVLATKADELLLVAGKGHETYQIIGQERRHFDDRETLRVAISQAKGTSFC